MNDERVRPSAHIHRRGAIGIVTGSAAVLFGILALAGVAPRTMAGIAALSLGIGLVARGARITRGLSEARLPPDATERGAELGEAAGDAILGGTGALVCAVLSLIGFAPILLLGVAVVSAGGAELLATPAHAQIPTRSRSLRLIDTTTLVLAGIAAITLGVLAVVGVHHAMTLASAGITVLGVALLGTALALSIERDAAHSERTAASEPADSHA